MTAKRLTGYHVLALFVGGFGIIIAVNVTMAVNAVRSFPGLETANSYVASQSFDARRAAQEALGWEASADYVDGAVSLVMTDVSARALDLGRFFVTLGRPTTRADDRVLEFDAGGRAEVALAPGLWHLDIVSREGEPDFARRVTLRVAP